MIPMKAGSCFSLVFPLLAALTALLGASAPARAYEVDDFTDRDKLTKDSLVAFDRKVNSVLDRAMNDANRELPIACNKAVLRQELVRWMRPEMVSYLELWAALSDEIQRTDVSLSNSIYGGLKVTESPGMWVVGIGKAFKLNGHVIGTDKIGHFFMQGLEYWKKVTEDGRDLDDVLQHDHREDGFYGYTGTGVKSYADMAANYDGYRFWKQLYGGANPYMKCNENGKWSKVRDFTWAEYVTAAWDEGINCSEFIPALQPRVAQNLARLHMECPVVPAECDVIRRLDKSQFYLSPKCGAHQPAPLAEAKRK